MRIRRVLEFWPLAVLCLLLAVRWMFADAWPGTQSTVASEAVAAVLAAGVCLVLSRFAPGVSVDAELRWPWGAAGAGALLFAGMNSGVLAGSASPRANDLLIALALAPAVIAVVLVSRGEAGAGLSGMDVAPGLLAPAGLLLILAQPAFRSVGEDVVMLTTPLCVGVGAAWLATRGEEGFGSRRAVLAFAGAAVLFAAAALRTGGTPTLAATALDLAVLLLALLSLARLGARRFSTQFAAVPLLLLLEGLVLTRVRPDWEQVGGLAMLLLAAILLLRSSNAERPENTALFS